MVFLRRTEFYLIMKVLRGGNLVTRKITMGICEILAKKKKIYLGNLDSKRDWGIKDYVIRYVENTSVQKPDDFVLATGKHIR